jgi:hypothetical protein
MNYLNKDKRLAESYASTVTMIATSPSAATLSITKQTTDENSRTYSRLAEDGQSYTRSYMVNASLC